MIIGIFIKIISVFLALVSAILPTWQLPSEVIAPFSLIAGYLTILNAYFPIGVLLQCILIALAFEACVLTIRLVLGILSTIRGGGKIDIV